MAINDILPPVDAVPGVNDSARQNAGAPSGSAATAESGYRRALSESLNRAERRGDSARSTDRRDQPQEAVNRRRTDETVGGSGQENLKTESSGRENDIETHGTATEATSRRESTPPDTDNAAAAVDEAVDAEHAIPPEEPLDAELLVAAGGALVPPDLSSLFVQQQQGDAADASSLAQAETEQGNAPVRPPDGLFESLRVDGRQNGQRVAAPADLQLPANGTPVEIIGQENSSAPAESNVTRNEVQQVEAIPLNSAPVTQLPVERSRQQTPEPTPVVIEAVEPAVETPAVVVTGVATHTTDAGNTATESNAAAANAIQQSGAIATPVSANSGATAQQTAPDGDVSQPSDASASNESNGSADGITNQNETASRVTATIAGERTETPGNSAQAGAAGGESTEPTSAGGESSSAAANGAAGQSMATAATSQQTPFVESSQGPLPLNSEQLVERLASEVQAAPQNGQQLRVRLYPPHLGSIQIEVTSHQGTLTVQMEVQSAAAQQTLQDSLSHLRDALMQHGSTVDRIEVQLVETRQEEGRSDLTDEQQQQQESGQQPAEDRPEQEQNGRPSEPETEADAVRVTTVRAMDELDIQV